MKDSSLHHEHKHDFPHYNNLPVLNPVEPICIGRYELRMKGEGEDMKLNDNVLLFELKRTTLKVRCNVNAYKLNTLIENMSKKDAFEIVYYTKTEEVTDALRGSLGFEDFTINGDYFSDEILFIEFTYNAHLQSMDQQTTAMINS